MDIEMPMASVIIFYATFKDVADLLLKTFVEDGPDEKTACARHLSWKALVYRAGGKSVAMLSAPSRGKIPWYLRPGRLPMPCSFIPESIPVITSTQSRESFAGGFPIQWVRHG